MNAAGDEVRKDANRAARNTLTLHQIRGRIYLAEASGDWSAVLEWAHREVEASREPSPEERLRSDPDWQKPQFGYQTVAIPQPAPDPGTPGREPDQPTAAELGVTAAAQALHEWVVANATRLATPATQREFFHRLAIVRERPPRPEGPREPSEAALDAALLFVARAAGNESVAEHLEMMYGAESQEAADTVEYYRDILRAAYAVDFAAAAAAQEKT